MAMPPALKKYWATHKRGKSRKSIRRSNTMKVRRNGKKKMTIPLAIVAGFMPAIADIKNNSANLGWGGSAMHTGAGLIGWDTVTGKWVGISQAKAAGTPAIIIGFIAHVLASKFGINRALGRAGIPLIRI